MEYQLWFEPNDCDKISFAENCLYVSEFFDDVADYKERIEEKYKDKGWLYIEEVFDSTIGEEIGD